MGLRVVCFYSGLLIVIGSGLTHLAAAHGPTFAPRASRAEAAVAADAEILVDDVPQPRYPHGGRLYVEALKGREYAIRLRNPFAVRVAVALAVDGLNTIDARETTARDARKWVIDPYGTITIRGWQTSQSEARHFEFTTEARSYGRALGHTANLGTITAVFFKKRVPPIIMEQRLRDGDDRRRERQTGREAQPALPSAAPAPSDGESSRAADNRAGARLDEFAATGMGRRSGHVVAEISLELEETPVQTVNLRYEFRHQLARLGIMPVDRAADPLTRRERARGFAPEFSPVPGGW